MPGKDQEYGKDFKTLSIVVSPEEHRAYRIKSAETGVTVSEVCRLALADETIWRKAQREKAKQRDEG